VFTVKPTRSIAVLIVVIMVFGVFMPVSSAERDSLHVIISAEDKIYETDDTIQFEIQVYNKGELTDASSVEVTLDTYWQHEDTELIVTSQTTGIYQGSYEITDEDAHAWFSVAVEKGTDTEYAELAINVYQDELELDIHFDHQNIAYAHPGDTLTATITAAYRDELVDVSEFTYLRLVDSDDAILPLEETKVSTGTYHVTVEIPETTDGGYHEIEAQAQYANARANANAYIAVNVLYVWYNLNSVAGNTATFTLGVADETGSAISDAEIHIISPQERTDTTDESGTTIFSITNIHDSTYVYGEVAAQGMNQSFGGLIYTSESEEPDPVHTGFDVIYEGDEYWYEPGTKVNRNYKAYNSSVPVHNKEIYYYITMNKMDLALQGSMLWPADGSHIDGASKVIDTGFTTCDSFGAFSIEFTAPSEQGFVEIVFECPISRYEGNYNEHFNPTFDLDDELVYEEDSDSVFIPKGSIGDSNDISVKSDPLVVGGRTKFTIKPEGGLGLGDQLFAKWMAGTSESGMYMDVSESDWISWVEGGNSIFLKKNGDGEYEGYTVIPEFISDDQEFTIVAGKVDSDSGYADVNSVNLKEGERAGEEPLDIVIMLLLLAVFIFAFLIIGIGALITRKEDAKKAGEAPSSEHSVDKGETSESPPPLKEYISNESGEDTQSPPPPDDYVPPTSQDTDENSPKT
jgi:hypothetical protein